MNKKLILCTLLYLSALASLDAQVSVTFNVDMSVKAAEQQFNPTTSSVYIRGNFNGWGLTQMFDPNVDLIYTTTLGNLTPGSIIYFKFFYDNPDTWESDPNREYIVPVGGGTFTDYFDRDSVINFPGDGNILFHVDMSVMVEIGIFDIYTDSLQVRGNFNGWNDLDPARSKMNQDPLDLNIFFLEVPFNNYPVGENQFYKYYVDLTVPGIWTDGWERPISQGGGNRDVIFEGLPFQDAGLVYYDDVDPDWVIEAGQNLLVEFRVDMTPAMDPNIQPIPFVPGTDTLFWICEQPAFARSQGWTDTEKLRVLQLTDPDGDTIYTATLAITPPTFNSFEYRYAWTNISGWTFEPLGDDSFGSRTRFIGQDAPRSFPVNPWVMPIDTWTNDLVKPDQEIDPYHSLPVELTSFTAQLNENQVSLQWQTATETNNQGFEIERRMDDNKWSRIGFVEGHGTTTEVQSYQFIDNVSNLNANIFTYRLKQIDYNGSFEYSDEVEVMNSISPDKFNLEQNFPNPFNPSTTIKFSLPNPNFVTLKILNVLGEEVAVLINKELTTGTYELEWSGSEYPSGVYFYHLKTDEFEVTKKMLLMK